MNPNLFFGSRVQEQQRVPVDRKIIVMLKEI